MAIADNTPSFIQKPRREIEPVELFFSPHVVPDIDFEVLGLLGNMIPNRCLLEYFRMPPLEVEISKCIRKLFVWHDKLQEQREEEEEEPLPSGVLPHLWIIATDISDELLDIFNAKTQPPEWCEGVYFTKEWFKTGIVSINHLPNIPDTLWLRLLGVGDVQEKAIEQFIVLPKENPLRGKVLNFIGNWWNNTQKEEEITEEYEHLFEILSPIYQQWQKENADCE
jgi:hypothetical protein